PWRGLRCRPVRSCASRKCCMAERSCPSSSAFSMASNLPRKISLRVMTVRVNLLGPPRPSALACCLYKSCPSLEAQPVEEFAPAQHQSREYLGCPRMRGSLLLTALSSAHSTAKPGLRLPLGPPLLAVRVSPSVRDRIAGAHVPKVH